MAHKGLVIVLIVLLLILVGMISGGLYLYTTGYFSYQTDTNNTVTSQTDTTKLPAEHQGNIQDLSFNIKDSEGQDRILHISFYAMTTLPQIQELFESHKGQISDAIIKQCATRTADEFLTIEGKNGFKEDMATEIVNIIQNDKHGQRIVIEKIHFTKFSIE